jgi:hypothetical protein
LSLIDRCGQSFPLPDICILPRYFIINGMNHMGVKILSEFNFIQQGFSCCSRDVFLPKKGATLFYMVWKSTIDGKADPFQYTRFGTFLSQRSKSPSSR